MKKNSLISFFLLLPLVISAQDLSFETGEGYPLTANDAKHPCITEEEYKQIEQQCADNVKLLELNNAHQKTMTTLLDFPLKSANGFKDCGYYYISNYADHDAASPGIQDWNCGNVTYDGHRGTDISTAPYPFYKLLNDEVEVIAAAAGTIIAKADGNFDKNCALNNLPANYIVIQHADNSRAFYYHMKMNSVTTKTIGQTVSVAEYLGIVGSSGNSDGPHLHFEIWSGATANTLQDPFAGSCNTLNATSWWANQKPYTEPAILKAQMNNVPPVFPACPTTESSNEDSCFAAGASARFYIFMRNATSSLTANMQIINPNGSIFSSWTYTNANNYKFLYAFSTRVLPSVAGTYTFEATYDGVSCSKIFTINCVATPTTEPGTAPNAPLNLTAANNGSLTNNITWTDNSNDEDNFVLYYNKGGVSNYTVLATLPANTTTYTHTGLSYTTTYCYQTTATNSAGTSAFSNTACATTPANGTGITEQNFLNLNTQVFPNPTSGEVMLQFPLLGAEARIEVINSMGEIVQSTKQAVNKNNLLIQLPKEKGLYFIKVTAGANNISTVKKVVVE